MTFGNKIRVNDIVRATAFMMAGDRELTTEMIMGKNRSRRISLPRMFCMYLARKHFPYSLPRIGHFFDRDHTTVIHAIGRLEEKYKTDNVFWNRLEEKVMSLAAEYALKRKIYAPIEKVNLQLSTGFTNDELLATATLDLPTHSVKISEYQDGDSHVATAT